MKNRRLKNKFERLRDRLWWFDIVYPTTLILFLFGSLTYMIYAGEPQYRLSKIAEKKLLTYSLTLAKGRPIKEKQKVLIVSASPFEVNDFGRAPGGTTPDVNAGGYAKVLRKLADSSIKNIFINWDTEAHLFDDVYMLPVLEAVQSVPKDVHVYFGMNPDHMDSMPSDFSKAATLLDSGPCDEVIEIQIECVYNRKWNDWMVQSVLNALGEDNRKEGETPSWISLELSSNSPRYILNLSPVDDIKQMSFHDLLAASPESLSSYEAVFVGVDYRNALTPTSTHAFPLMVKTIYDHEKGDPLFTGTPLHMFWAQLAQMYIDKHMILVPTSAVIWAVTICFSLLIVAVMFYFGGLHALGMFLMFGIFGPIVNAWSIRSLQIYVPMFDSYYMGVTILISTGMLRLSYASYQRWRLETESHYHNKIMDLKSNFISLFSHNLNTPVAKMQGMLGILKTSVNSMPQSARTLAQEADAYVGLLEYTIRGVLVGTAIEERSINDTPRALKNLYVDVLESNASSLRRLGVHIAPELGHTQEDDLLYTPFQFDVRALSSTISSLAALFRSGGDEVNVKVRMQAQEDEEGRQSLIVRFSSLQGKISQQAQEILREPSKRKTLKRLQGDRFIDEVLASLAILFVQHYRGSISQETVQDSGYELSFTVFCPQQ